MIAKNGRGRCLVLMAVLFAFGAQAGEEPKAQRQRPAKKAAAPQKQRPLPPGIKAERDVPYVEGGVKAQALDIFYPEKAEGKMPLVVWIHGGAWSGGDKAQNPALRLLDRGYVVASTNYRLSGEAIFPAQIHDCKAAIRWLRANAAKYHIDPDRIGVWGGSAGGHLVALMGTSGDVKELEGKDGPLDVSSRVQAVCDFFGPTDFTKMGDSPGGLKHNAPDSPESKLIGAPILENPDKCAKANPITYITKDDPPMLIMHGDQDMTVPHSQSVLLHEAMKKAGLNVSFHTVEGGGHGFGGLEVDEKVNAFFDRVLKAKK